MGITDEIKVSTIANVLHFQNFCFAYFLVFVVSVVTLSSLATLPHKIIFNLRDFMENARQNRHLQVPYSGSEVSRKHFRRS